MHRLLVAATVVTLAVAADAAQLTLGDWDFVGADCFPDYTIGWNFNATGGAGVTVVGITSEDLGGMMQYQVVCEGEGVLYCSLSDCGLGGSNGVNFTCLIPADNFDHYLVELLTEPVGSFCDYCGNTTEVKPSGWQLEDCYPNPFNPTTTIEYSLAEPCGVTMNVYNMSGQYVANLVNRRMPGGTHSVVLDASHLMSGVYTVHLQAGKFTASQRVTLLK